VFGEDPTARALEEEVARITGKEAAMFVSSGTMGNQLAIGCHTRPGDEVIVAQGAHPVWYEVGGGAVLSGVQFVEVGEGGIFNADQMEEAIKPVAYWSPRTSLVCVENTHNRAGGRVFPQHEAIAIAKRARAQSEPFGMHLDGARIWNAAIATKMSVAELCAPFDTVSVCFSKGLGAPIWSAFCGPKAMMVRAHRLRKMWGGGMRQIGIVAAGALHALAHHRERLAIDHANARAFAERMARVKGAHVDLARVETNIVNVELDAPLLAENVAKIARTTGIGVAVNSTGPRRLRAVTHLDVTREQMDEAADILADVIQKGLSA
jgi:threonine aldolase